LFSTEDDDSTGKQIVLSEEEEEHNASLHTIKTNNSDSHSPSRHRSSPLIETCLLSSPHRGYYEK
jgi:hypothetical protein